MENLKTAIESLVKKEGAIDVGYATTQTLEGGPPSADLTYVLPEAKSAICFAVPEQRAQAKFLKSGPRPALEISIVSAAMSALRDRNELFWSFISGFT